MLGKVELVFKSRMKNVHLTCADMCRETGINYTILNRHLNGTYTMTPKDLKLFEHTLFKLEQTRDVEQIPDVDYGPNLG